MLLCSGPANANVNLQPVPLMRAYWVICAVLGPLRTSHLVFQASCEVSMFINEEGLQQGCDASCPASVPSAQCSQDSNPGLPDSEAWVYFWMSTPYHVPSNPGPQACFVLLVCWSGLTSRIAEFTLVTFTSAWPFFFFFLCWSKESC